MAAINALGEVTLTAWNNLQQKTAVTQYAARVTSTTLATLNGGLLTASVKNTLDNLANASIDSKTSYGYNVDGSLASETDAVGVVTQYGYDSFGARTTVTLPAAGATPLTRSDHDRRGLQLAQVTDPNSLNLAVGMQYDAFGRVTTSTDALGGTVRFSYDRLDRVRFSVDAIGAVTRYDYDVSGNMVRRTEYDLAIATGADPATAQPSAADRVTRHVYDGANRLIWSVDAVGSVTGFDYDASNNLIRRTAYAATIGASADPATVQVSAGADQVTRNSYDLNNRLVRTIDAMGAIVDFSYDDDGRLVQSIAYAQSNGATPVASASNDREINYDYDAAGRQIRTRTPNSLVYRGEDAGTLASNGANGNATRADDSREIGTRSWYDAVGNLVISEDAAGNRTYQVRDAAGRSVYDIDAEGYVTGRQVDAQGNVTSVTRYADKIADATRASWGDSAPSTATVAALLNAANSANRTTTMQYDKAGRMVLETRPVVYAYDGVSGFSASPSTRYTYNARGDVIRKEELQRGTTWLSTWYYYDADGRQTASIDALGYLTTSLYDTAGNVIELTEYAAAASGISTSGYTSAASQASDRTVRYTWDGNGRKLTETRLNVDTMQAGGSQTGLSIYADSNYLGASQSLSAGLYRAADLTIGDNALSSFKVTQGWKATLYENDNFQGRTLLVEGGDFAALSPFGLDNMFSSIAVVCTGARSDLTTTYQYDAFGNVVRVTDAGANSSYTWYDQANRISAVATPARQGTTAGSTLNGLTRFVRNAFGDVIQQTDSAAGATSVSTAGYTYGASTDDRVASMKYDNRGQQIESTDALGNTRYYSYDANGNLAKQWQNVAGNDGAVQTFYNATRYDRRGAAVLVNDAGKQTQMRYNAFGEMTGRGGKAGLDLFGTQALGWQEYFDYDNGGRLWRSNAGDGVNKVMLYDLQNNFSADIRSPGVDLQAQSTAAAIDALTGTRRVNSQFDALGRVTQQKLANGASVYQTWDRWRNRLSVSDARNAAWKTDYTYNASNQVTMERRPVTNLQATMLASYADQRPLTEYFYDYAGNLVAQRDGRGNLTRKAYDAMGNLLTESHADGGVVSHYYDAFNQEVRRVDVLGNATGYAYDKLGRLVTVQRAAANFYSVNTGTYNNAATDTEAPVTVYQNSSYGGAVSYFGAGTWDNLNKEISSLKVASGWQVVMYDDDSGIDGGAHDRTYTTSQSSLPSDLNDDVKKLRVSRINGAEAQVSQSATTVTALSFSYDALGRRLSSADGSGTTSYAYDLAGHVTGVGRPGMASTVALFDSAGYKCYEANAGGDAMSWNNDYFGRAITHNTLDGASTTYTYDYAGQLYREVSSNGRDVITTFDIAGQATKIVDKITATGSRTTDYTYDLAGNRTSEKTAGASGTVYQNETIAYDALGHMTSVIDTGNSVSVYYYYDLAGNRARQYRVVSGVGDNSYFAYDAMDRQILVNGAADNNVNNTANVTGAKGQVIAYDLNDNRMSEKSAGLVENYSYDALGRLVKVTQNGSTLRTVKYDVADRVVESFDRSQAGQTAAVHYTNLYDTAGRLKRQYHRAGSTISASDVITTGTDDSLTFNTYDANGNLIRAVDQMFGEHLFITTSTTSWIRKGDNYLQSTIVSSRSDNSGNPGKSTFSYDLNGYLGSVTDEDNTANTRSFVTNVNGQFLQKTQQSNVLRNLVANGQVLGTYGVGVDTEKPPVVSKVQVKIIMHVVSQNDGATATSEYNLTFSATGKTGTMYVDDVDDGSEHCMTLSGVSWPPANGTLTVQLSGSEDDTTSADDPLPSGTLSIAASSWTTEGQTFTSATFSNSTATYYLKVKISADQSAPSYTDTVRNFNVAYQEIDAAHPGGGPGSYTVRAGDTLQGIAAGAYGDRALWYLIADANGLRSDADLRAGLVLDLPATVGTVHNNADTWRPYESARIIGSTDPTLATPASSVNTCKSVSIIIAAVVASIVVAIAATALTAFTLGALGVPAMSAAGVVISLVFAAAGGAVSSMVSQGVMIAGGLQQEMDWAAVGAEAISGAVTAGVGAKIGKTVSNAVKKTSEALASARSALEASKRAVSIARAFRNLQGAQNNIALLDDATRLFNVAKKVKMPKYVSMFGASDKAQKASSVTNYAKLSLASQMKNKAMLGADEMSESISNMLAETLFQATRSDEEKHGFNWKQVLLAGVSFGKAPVTKVEVGPMADAEKMLLRNVALQKDLKAHEHELRYVSDLVQKGQGSRRVKQPGMTDSLKDSKYYQFGKSVANSRPGSAASTLLGGFASGFASGMLKSSLYQGVSMGVDGQEGFDIESAMMFGVANGAAGALNKGMLAGGQTLTGKSTAEMDTWGYDNVRIASSIVSTLAMNWAFNGFTSDQSVAGIESMQQATVNSAVLLGSIRNSRGTVRA